MSSDSLTGINSIFNSQSIKVYPNPSYREFTFQLSGINNQASVEVYNIMGEQINTAPLNPPVKGTSISIISLPNGEGWGGAGIYLYRIVE